MKNYIRNEGHGWETSSAHIKVLAKASIQFARAYRDEGNPKDRFEALRLLGSLVSSNIQMCFVPFIIRLDSFLSSCFSCSRIHSRYVSSS